MSPPRSRLRGAYWHLRHWLPNAVKSALRASRESPIRPAHLGVWLDEAHESAHADLGGQRLVLFAYLPWWMDFMTAISAALIGRGADVTLAWLPYWSFERETPRKDEEILGRYHSVLARERTRFHSVNLIDVAAEPAELTNQMRRMAFVDTQYVRRREEIDTEGEDQSLFEFRLHRLRQSYAAFRRVLAENRFSSVLLPSGGVLEFAAVWQAAHDASVGNITIESWERLGTCAVAYGRPCFVDIARELWEADSKRLDDARRARVAGSMRERESPGWNGHVISYQNADMQADLALRNALGLDARPVALVCPNVPYDAAFLGLESGFASMADWLRALLRQLALRSDWQVVVRAHPGEVALQSRQSAESILVGALPQRPEHLHFISPSERVNTYNLMRIADLGLVFGSTTGLEMAARGLPVVVPVATHYSRKGFTEDAFTREEYAAAVQRQLDHPRRLSQATVDLAWSYMDVYMNQWCRPFPWSLSTFSKDIREWPLNRVLSPAGMARFAETFTILAGGDRARAYLRQPPGRPDEQG